MVSCAEMLIFADHKNVPHLVGQPTLEIGKGTRFLHLSGLRRRVVKNSFPINPPGEHTCNL